MIVVGDVVGGSVGVVDVGDDVEDRLGDGGPRESMVWGGRWSVLIDLRAWMRECAGGELVIAVRGVQW